jgi:myo-inositol-1(or 4)-monophosphatase
MIRALPAKEEGDNFFAAALTDADLAVQNFVEVALLGTFPEIRFYGEERDKSSNTKYFRAGDIGAAGDYLITLDPIDGTRYYLDGHNNYQVILGILNDDDYEAVLAISPSQDCYYYALRGEGTFRGKLSQDLESCQRIQVDATPKPIFLGFKMTALKPLLQDQYEVISVTTDYSHERQVPNVNGLLSGDLSGVALRMGKFIDGAALAFLAREAGCIVTTLEGEVLPPLKDCPNYSLPGLIIADSPGVYQAILKANQEL